MPSIRAAARVVLFWLAAVASASAQSPQAAPSAEAAVHAEILKLRESIRAAVAAQDRAALERFYADNFSHIRDTGRIDLKGDRIALLLSGASAIETAPEDELEVQSYGSGAAAAIGVSRVVDGGTDRPAPFRWLTVYVRDGAAWRVALSQASRVAGRR